jgi:hypothetical protein
MKVILYFIIIGSITSIAFAADSSDLISVEHYVSPESINISGSADPTLGSVILEITGAGNIPRKNIDAVLVMDISNSMSEPYLPVMKQAMKKLIDRMDPSTDKIGFVSFGSSLGTLIDPTSDFKNMSITIDSINIDNESLSGRTCLGIGLGKAIEMLSNQKDDSQKLVIFLSDGNNRCTNSNNPCADSEKAKNLGIMIFPVGINDSGEGSSYLQCMAITTGGSYYSTYIEGIEKLFINLSKELPLIVAKNVTLDYKFSQGIDISDIQSHGLIRKSNESNLLQASLGTISANETKTISFSVSGREPGRFYLALENNSQIMFSGIDGTSIPLDIPMKSIQVKGQIPPNRIQSRTEIKNERNINSHPFEFEFQGSKIARIDPRTNVTIQKSVSGGPFGPRIAMTLVAPGIGEIDTKVAIALDSSGSLGKGGRIEYGSYMREAMPEVLGEIEKVMPKSNISIISWDDDVDFAYYPLSNKNPLLVKMVPVSEAKKEIVEKEVFSYNIPFNYPLFYPSQRVNWTVPYPINVIIAPFFAKKLAPIEYYYCNETESTNLSIGLDSARAVLNDTGLDKSQAPLKLILLFVARSEFSPCSNDIIEKTTGKKYANCDVHTIGIGVIEGSELEGELIKMATNYSNYHYSPGSSSFTRGVATDAIKDAIYKFSTKIILDNISVVDTLYPYLRIDAASIDATLNGNPLNKDLFDINQQPNSDGTTTFTASFNKGIGMRQKDILRVSFNTYLDLSLPVDATTDRNKKQFYISEVTNRSIISYRWIGNNIMYGMPLPPSPISLEE